MKIPKFLQKFIEKFESRRLFYFLIMGLIVLAIESNRAYLTQKYGSLETTLSSGSLLTLAGLTITFYVLLEHVIEKEWGIEDRYAHLKGSVTNLIIFNVLIVSLSILVIMVSTIGAESLKMTGFTLLFLSWTYNIVIMVYLYGYPFIEIALSTKWQRILLNLWFLICLIWSSINYFFKYLN